MFNCRTLDNEVRILLLFAHAINCIVSVLCNQDLEVPIVTYKRFASGMALDDSVCTAGDEEKCKAAVAKYSPLKNDLSIGAQFAKIESTGTRIFLYNLEQWDGKCISSGQQAELVRVKSGLKTSQIY